MRDNHRVTSRNLTLGSGSYSPSLAGNGGSFVATQTFFDIAQTRVTAVPLLRVCFQWPNVGGDNGEYTRERVNACHN